MLRGHRSSVRNSKGANLGFETTLLATVDYKHIALGLSFLEHLSDVFKERKRRLLK